MAYFKFENLDVWKRSMNWANQVFDLAQSLPIEYRYSLADQLRRASLSVPTNIAEGTGRDGVKERKYFFRVAKGSVYEVVSLLVMVRMRDLLSEERYNDLYQEANQLSAMLSAMAR